MRNLPTGNCQNCVHTFGTLGCCDTDNNTLYYDCDEGMAKYINPPPMRRIRTAWELRNADPKDLTPEEQERLRKYEAIPECVKQVLTERIKAERAAVVEAEKIIDQLSDYLNGFDVVDGEAAMKREVPL